MIAHRKMKPTYTLLPDLQDTPNPPTDIEAEQEENLIERLGLEKWGDLCQMEAEHGKTFCDIL